MKTFTKLMIVCMLVIFGIAGAQAQKGSVSLTGTAASQSGTHIMQASDLSATAGSIAESSAVKALFDLQFSYSITGNGIGKAGIETDGQYFYVTRWSGTTFYRYNLAGTFVDSFSITGVSGIRDLAYDGQYFYGGAASNVIYKMDFTAHTLIGTITCPSAVAVRHIAYDPVNNGFWCGNWATDITLVNMSGSVVTTIPAATHGQTDIYGSAYDNFSAGGPYLWLYKQTGNLNDLVKISLPSGTPSGTSFDVTTVVPSTGSAGGLCIAEGIVPNKASLIGVIQNEKIWGLELKDLAVFPNDMGPTAVIKPTSAMLLTAADTIKVMVKNFDTVAHSGIPISYVVDGGTPVNETIAASIPGQNSLAFAFNQLCDLSIPGKVYDIMIYTAFPGDANPYNDTIEVQVTNFYDVAPVSIDEPPVIGPGTISPKATVVNNGTLATSFTVTMNITGGYTSTKSVTNLAPAATQQVTFDPWNAALGNYTITVFTTLVKDSVITNDTLTQAISVQNLVKAYCYIAYDPDATPLPTGPATTFLQAPQTLNSIADQSTMQFVGAGTWGPFKKWYGVVYGDNDLITMDTLTGARTVIGNVGASISGLTYDWSTHKMYGVDWDGTNSNLYLINIGSGAGTKIATISTQLMINLACSLTGQLYAVSITDDNLYSIDKTTGAATLIGNVGFDAAYAQDMEFDHVNGICYMAAYNGANSAGEMRTVNLTSGATSFIGTFYHNAEITGLAIPYTGATPANDAGVVAVLQPESSCDLNVAAVEIKVMNFGSSPITDLRVAYTLDGATPVVDTVVGILQPGAVQNFTFTVMPSFTPGAHTLTVYSMLTGDADPSNDTTHKQVSRIIPVTIPYTMGFEPSENLEGWKIVDANNDGYTWFLAATGGNTAPHCMEYSYNTSAAANDWFITTCIDLESSKTYQLAFYYKAQSATYPEKVKVMYGTDNDPASLTSQIVDLNNITTVTYTQSTSTFTVPATGTYYLGWKCYSAADMYNLFVDDIAITEYTGIEDNKSNITLGVYPNPARDQVTIISAEEDAVLTITNSFGSLVFSAAMSTSVLNVNTSGFGSGLYFVKVQSANGSSVQKLIINR